MDRTRTRFARAARALLAALLAVGLVPAAAIAGLASPQEADAASQRRSGNPWTNGDIVWCEEGYGDSYAELACVPTITSVTDLGYAAAPGWGVPEVVKSLSGNITGWGASDYSYAYELSDPTGLAPFIDMPSRLHCIMPAKAATNPGQREAKFFLLEMQETSFGWRGEFALVVFGNGGDQATMGVEKVYVEWEEDGWVQLEKSSASPSITDGNACYSLAGATYGIYKDAACASRVGGMTTDASGRAKSGALQQGTYYVREESPSPGYGLDATVHRVQVRAGETATVTSSEPAQNDPAAMWVGKVDADTTESMPQGSASLAGAEYTVKYYAGYYSQSDLPQTATRTWVVKTDEEGRAVLLDSYKVSGDAFYKNSYGHPVIPLGTVTVQETKAPEGYLLGDQPIYVMQCREDGHLESVETYNAPKDPEQVIRGGVEVKKEDSDAAHDGTAQGDATLAGIAYAIVNESDGSVTVDGQSHAKGEVCTTITTDAEGHAATAADALPYGSYSVHEVAKAGNLANDGYLLGDEVKRFDVTENGAVVSLVDDGFENDVVRGNVTFKKLDRETGEPWAQAAGDLGASFEIVNESQRSVVVGGADRQPGEVVYSGKAERTDAGWTFSTPDRLLPYGSYSIREVKPGTGYEGSDQVAEFQIREDGKTVDLAETTGGTFTNQVVRADIKLQKRDDTTGKAMAGVPFLITSKTTGESHVAVTDGRGSIDTSATRTAANAFDAALGADGSIDEGKLAELVERYGTADGPDAWPGVWFGTAEDGSAAEASSALGALPYDEYELKELACEANEGRQLVEDSFAIVRSDDRAVIDFGTMDDVEPSIRTNAWDGASNSPADKEIVADDEACVVDRVSYEDLVPGRAYHAVAELHDADSGEILRDAQGNEVRAEADFTPDKKNGSIDMRLAFDASSLADGQKAAVYEHVTLDGRDIAEHADKDDAEQAVTFHKPAIATTAKASDGTKVLKLDPEAKLTDTVACKNLREGADYVLSLEVVKAADGSAALDAQGNAVTASKEFTATAADMSIDVEATFDASQLEDGTDLVCFETLTKKATGSVAAEHKDLAAAGQTLTTAKARISTTMTDAAGAGHAAAADDQMHLVDKVEHWGLIADGRPYELDAQLMVVGVGTDGKVSAEPYIDFDGKEVKAVKEFTPDTAHGFVDVELAFNGLNLEDGQRLVCFETLKRAGSELAEHADAADEGQTVEVALPKIGTILADAADGDKNVASNDPVRLTDTVSFTGLVPGREYVVSGALMQKDGSGEAVAVRDDSGDPVTARTTFTAEKANGTVDVAFDFAGSGLPHGAQLVAFESLSRSGVELAAHADIDDAAQTVEVANPLIATELTDKTDGDHTILPSTETVVVDEVEYDNLIPGKTYKISGRLVLKDTGKQLYVGDKPVTAEREFAPNAASGCVEVEFSFDSSALDGKELVAFETLSKDGVEVAAHESIDDAAQTVAVDSLNGAKGKAYSKTGVSMSDYAWLGWMLLLAAAGTFCAGEAAHRRDVRRAAAAADSSE